MKEPGWYLAAMMAIAAGGILLQLLLSRHGSGKIEGIVSQSLNDHSRRIDENKRDTDKRIDEMKNDFEKDVAALKETDNDQWGEIRATAADVNTIKGRLNGKAFGASH